MQLFTRLSFVLLILGLSFSLTTHAASSDADKVQSILNRSDPPQGVVFEVVSSDKDALKWAIPRIQAYIKQLRSQFADLEIAVVSHGREQFLLQTKHAESNQEVHTAIKQLSGAGEVPVHVCQTFAEWNNVQPEAFPEYVNVSPTGPQQIRDYVDLGYELIKLKKPK